MAEKALVETVYGKYHKFEIMKESSVFSTKFYVYKDGKYHKGSYSSLNDAVNAAKKEG